jgi:hypothetical protein
MTASSPPALNLSKVLQREGTHLRTRRAPASASVAVYQCYIPLPLSCPPPGLVQDPLVPVALVLPTPDSILWSAHFEIRPNTSFITWNSDLALYKLDPRQRGLHVAAPFREGELRFLTPPFLGPVYPESAAPLLAGSHDGRFLFAMTGGRICNSAAFASSLSCQASYVNCVRHAYICLDPTNRAMLEGRPEPDPAWTRAIPNVRLIRPVRDLTMCYINLAEHDGQLNAVYPPGTMCVRWPLNYTS